jgi:GTP-binding protein
VAANKCDLCGDDRENIERLKAHVEALGYEFFEMSAATHSGTHELVNMASEMLSELPPVIRFEADYVPPEPVIDTSEDLTIEKYDDVWVVEGGWLQRLMSSVNFSDNESMMYFDRVLRDNGVYQRMEDMGIQDGDTVSIYNLEFEYRD